ncbi:hypothetical protein LJR090_004121 [Bosea sp. LjRoot90]|uniref:hypothetical protein n=1 Tax=Bosea sp. LjRoot90 TaxID=3342342 RepID=UPI003ECDC1F3
MTIKLLAALAATAALVGGCNSTSTFTTKVNTPVIVAAYGMYADRACTSAEPPEPSVSSPPANGRVTTVLGKTPIRQKGHPCDGALLDRMISTYSPSAGFRGQDRFTIKYDYITDDGGGRATNSLDFIVDVK